MVPIFTTQVQGSRSPYSPATLVNTVPATQSKSLIFTLYRSVGPSCEFHGPLSCVSGSLAYLAVQSFAELVPQHIRGLTVCSSIPEPPLTCTHVDFVRHCQNHKMRIRSRGCARPTPYQMLWRMCLLLWKVMKKSLTVGRAVIAKKMEMLWTRVSFILKRILKNGKA